MRQATLETSVALAGAVLSGCGLWHALGFTRDSAYLPTAVMSLLTLLLLVWGIRSAWSLRQAGSDTLRFAPSHARRFLTLLATSVAMIAIAPRLGFATTFLLFVPVSGWLLGYRQGKWLVTTAILFSLLIYLIFQIVLDRPLPPELALRLVTGS
ncbi:tripartite tricarboxylate transporter TctB family protein [Salinicola tamaricis]|uniref:tripartite tricarboxylate transporter TctB family protein n=1 Tax=Salinicola tamaricis TaxID=1771309 RepID=UPI000D0A0E7D|nr:tripartite tricarboxylate transporter TctB family protein [Salinicola tamaricis]